MKRDLHNQEKQVRFLASLEMTNEGLEMTLPATRHSEGVHSLRFSINSATGESVKIEIPIHQVTI